ncbi:two-component system regulatory protein YycI [Allofustis seminis]|uniref:two-component system regulatory protein YycI n=1 Tax=Allofustis seminis TaxID=166939 RepID=UPI000379181F|nr:two-component system regulatory protein YycI [Allofustis seminis]
MNFEKVERIFIIAFVLLNIFLFVSYVNRQNLQHISQDSNQVDILKEMESAGIEAPKKLATETEQQKLFSMQANANELLKNKQEELRNQAGNISEEGSLYRSLLSDPIILQGTPEKGFTKEDTKKLSEMLMTSLFLFGEEYMYSHYDEVLKQFVFYQKVDNIPVADGTSQIVMNVNDKGQVFSYEQTYAGPMSKQGKPLTIISALRAVEILFINNQLPSGSKLSMPELAYRRSLHLEDLSMYTPVWIVTLTNEAGEKNNLRVDAVSGTILRDETATKAEENETEE